MEKTITIKSKSYEIPAILSYDETKEKMPAVILCHGTGSHKNEVGDFFVKLSKRLLDIKIASVRFDFAGCGDSKAEQTELSFYGEVEDTKLVYQYLCNLECIDSNSIGILGFSQGARVMAEVLKDIPEMKFAVSWSGACQNGIGVFADIFENYYSEAEVNGFARIPMDWRDDLILSKEWFDEIKNSNPLDNIHKYSGPILAIAGYEDQIVPCQSASEIISNSTHDKSLSVIIPKADHVFYVLNTEKSKENMVLDITMDWIKTILE